MVAWLLAVGACFALWIPAHGVNAQGPLPAEYVSLIEQALSEYELQNFVEARALFHQANALFPNARTQRGLGMVEFELKNYGESITQLEAALASQVKPLEGELRAHTEALLARARAFVALYELHLKPQRQGSRIIVDGIPVEIASGQTLNLTIGEHVLEVQAPDYQSEKRALSVKGGERQRIVIELRPQLPTEPVRAVNPLALPAPPSKQERSLRTNPWLWTGVGAAVVAGVVAAVLLSQRSSGPRQLEPVKGDVGGGVVQTLVAK